MTKEDKQIIKRATKESWRIGDRSHLKRLLEKNLELYRENVELEKRCEETQELLDKQIEATYKLDKENAELKSEKGCETCVKFDKVNLTKAKEIIKNLLILKNDHYGNTKMEWRVEVSEQAEQFLKEIEK